MGSLSTDYAALSSEALNDRGVKQTRELLRKEHPEKIEARHHAEDGDENDQLLGGRHFENRIH